MKKALQARYFLESLCIYDFKDDEIINALYELLCSIDSEDVLSKQSKFFKLISKKPSLNHYISQQIVSNDNVFSKAAAGGNADKLPSSIIEAVKLDLKKLEEIGKLTLDDIIECREDNDVTRVLATMPKWSESSAHYPFFENWEDAYDDLVEYHKTNGYGVYVKYDAFTWRDGKLSPISSLNSIRLGDLKNYELQRQQVVDNTEAFLQGLPANNVLLYGDRGTGKSSTIHAILNEYNVQKLRMIEISKGDINDLTLIREQIADSPMKFIIFIDDLSFDSHEDSFGELKAALEGSLSGKQSNTLIYATSNRRHLIKENFSDRDNDVHRSDTLQEELSLSDRFGLSITFMNPEKAEFLDIVSKIASDRGLEPSEKLLNGADRWALRRGGRSPRCAKQYIDHVEACQKRGMEW